jgi:hypothetical protein
MEVHIYNASYSGGICRRIHDARPTSAKREIPSEKKAAKYKG